MKEEIDRSAVGPEDAMLYIQDCLERNVPFMLVGPPGIGKTALANQAVKVAGMEIDPLMLSGFNPTHLTGLGSAAGDHAEFLPFGFLYRMMKATKPYLVFFDDVGTAPESVQSLAKELFWGRTLNGVKMPECVRFGMATNSAGDRAGVRQVITPFSTRNHIIRLIAKVEDWCNWADGAGMPGELVSYIEGFPQALFEFNPGNEIKNCPIPRNWERIGKTILHSKLPERLLMGSFMNDVGEHRGTEFYAFQKVYKNIPNIRDIENDPHNAMLPEDKPAVVMATVSQLYQSAGYSNFKAYCTYVKRMRMELVKLFMAGVRKRHGELVETGEYGDLELHSKRGY